MFRSSNHNGNDPPAVNNVQSIRTDPVPVSSTNTTTESEDDSSTVGSSTTQTTFYDAWKFEIESLKSRLDRQLQTMAEKSQHEMDVLSAAVTGHLQIQPSNEYEINSTTDISKVVAPARTTRTGVHNTANSDGDAAPNASNTTSFPMNMESARRHSVLDTVSQHAALVASALARTRGSNVTIDDRPLSPKSIHRLRSQQTRWINQRRKASQNVVMNSQTLQSGLAKPAAPGLMPSASNTSVGNRSERTEPKSNLTRHVTARRIRGCLVPSRSNGSVASGAQSPAFMNSNNNGLLDEIDTIGSKASSEFNYSFSRAMSPNLVGRATGTPINYPAPIDEEEDGTMTTDEEEENNQYIDSQMQIEQDAKGPQKPNQLRNQLQTINEYQHSRVHKNHREESILVVGEELDRTGASSQSYGDVSESLTPKEWDDEVIAVRHEMDRVKCILQGDQKLDRLQFHDLDEYVSSSLSDEFLISNDGFDQVSQLLKYAKSDIENGVYSDGAEDWTDYNIATMQDYYSADNKNADNDKESNSSSPEQSPTEASLNRYNDLTNEARYKRNRSFDPVVERRQKSATPVTREFLSIFERMDEWRMDDEEDMRGGDAPALKIPSSPPSNRPDAPVQSDDNFSQRSEINSPRENSITSNCEENRTKHTFQSQLRYTGANTSNTQRTDNNGRPSSSLAGSDCDRREDYCYGLNSAVDKRQSAAYNGSKEALVGIGEDTVLCSSYDEMDDLGVSGDENQTKDTQKRSLPVTQTKHIVGRSGTSSDQVQPILQRSYPVHGDERWISTHSVRRDETIIPGSNTGANMLNEPERRDANHDFQLIQRECSLLQSQGTHMAHHRTNENSHSLPRKTREGEDRYSFMKNPRQANNAEQPATKINAIGECPTAKNIHKQRSHEKRAKDNCKLVNPANCDGGENQTANFESSSRAARERGNRQIQQQCQGEVAMPSKSTDEKRSCENPSQVELEHTFNCTISDHNGDFGKYSGTLLGFEPSGTGTMSYGDGRTYTGEWRKGRWHGHGTTIFTNGDRYTGDYCKDQRHGIGRYEWYDGRVYDGCFQFDHRQGRGIYSWPDGSVYTGDFTEGLRHGFGSHTFADGSVYTGAWKNGKYDGDGECRWKDGRCYRGEWKEGRANGYGVETKADGTVRHSGVWCDNKPVRQLPRNPEILVPKDRKELNNYDKSHDGSLQQCHRSLTERAKVQVSEFSEREARRSKSQSRQSSNVASDHARRSISNPRVEPTQPSNVHDKKEARNGKNGERKRHDLRTSHLDQPVSQSRKVETRRAMNRGRNDTSRINRLAPLRSNSVIRLEGPKTSDMLEEPNPTNDRRNCMTKDHALTLSNYHQNNANIKETRQSKDDSVGKMAKNELATKFNTASGIPRKVVEGQDLGRLSIPETRSHQKRLLASTLTNNRDNNPDDYVIFLHGTRVDPATEELWREFCASRQQEQIDDKESPIYIVAPESTSGHLRQQNSMQSKAGNATTHKQEPRASPRKIHTSSPITRPSNTVIPRSKFNVTRHRNHVPVVAGEDAFHNGVFSENHAHAIVEGARVEGTEEYGNRHHRYYFNSLRKDCRGDKVSRPTSRRDRDPLKTFANPPSPRRLSHLEGADELIVIRD